MANVKYLFWKVVCKVYLYWRKLWSFCHPIKVKEDASWDDVRKAMAVVEKETASTHRLMRFAERRDAALIERFE